MCTAAEPTVLFIVGPTASGKTDAALAVADALSACGKHAEVVNADSRQVYRRMSIGTAKPMPSELARAPHHLFDVADPTDGFNLATFLRLARGAISDIVERGNVPVVAGGTGQYVWGLVEGWQAPGVPPDPEARSRLEAEGSAALYTRLQKADPASAESIDPRNLRRLVRAMEVIEATGLPFSEQRTKSSPGFAPLVLGITIPRDALYERIDARVDAMLESGLVEEVRGLLAGGNARDVPAFSSVGYREVCAYLAGEITLDQATAKMKTETHRLARSQDNWFSATDERIHWHADQATLVTEALRACCS